MKCFYNLCKKCKQLEPQFGNLQGKCLIQKFSDGKHLCVISVEGIIHEVHFTFPIIASLTLAKVSGIKLHASHGVLRSIIYLYSHTLCSCHFQFYREQFHFHGCLYNQTFNVTNDGQQLGHMAETKISLDSSFLSIQVTAENVPRGTGTEGGFLQIFTEEKVIEMKKSLESK